MITIHYNVHLPSPQRCPSNPGLQIHLYLFISSLHSALFRQGLLIHSLISKIKRKKDMKTLMTIFPIVYLIDFVNKNKVNEKMNTKDLLFCINMEYTWCDNNMCILYIYIYIYNKFFFILLYLLQYNTLYKTLKIAMLNNVLNTKHLILLLIWISWLKIYLIVSVSHCHWNNCVNHAILSLVLRLCIAYLDVECSCIVIIVTIMDFNQ